MKDGLYNIEFATHLGSGAGVVVLRDGKIRGGDSSMYYVGDYSLDGDAVRASVSVSRRHNSRRDIGAGERSRNLDPGGGLHARFRAVEGSS